MTTLRIPEIESGASILHVTDETGTAVLEIRKLPKRIAIVAEVNGVELYKVREDSNDANVSIVDLKVNKVVEKFRSRLLGGQASQNFKLKKSSIKENGTIVAEIRGHQLKISDYENHALLVAVYIAAKKLEFVSALDLYDMDDSIAVARVSPFFL